MAKSDYIFLNNIKEMLKWNENPVSKTEKLTFLGEGFLDRFIDKCPRSYKNFLNNIYIYKRFTAISEEITDVAAFGIITTHLRFWYKAKEKDNKRFKKFYMKYLLDSVGI